MTVLDLIIKLQQFDPNKKVYIDVTQEGSTMFKYGEPHFVEEVGDDIDPETYVVVSAIDWSSLAEQDEDDKSYLN